MAYDWRKFRPMNDWVLVKEDKRREKTAGGIILTEQMLLAERVTEGAGTVLKAGPGVKKVLVNGLEPGERICFRSFLKDVYHDFEPDEDGCRIFILKAADIMMSIDKSVDVGIFS